MPIKLSQQKIQEGLVSAQQLVSTAVEQIEVAQSAADIAIYVLHLAGGVFPEEDTILILDESHITSAGRKPLTEAIGRWLEAKSTAGITHPGAVELALRVDQVRRARHGRSDTDSWIGSEYMLTELIEENQLKSELGDLLHSRHGLQGGGIIAVCGGHWTLPAWMEKYGWPHKEVHLCVRVADNICMAENYPAMHKEALSHLATDIGVPNEFFESVRSALRQFRQQLLDAIQQRLANMQVTEADTSSP